MNQWAFITIAIIGFVLWHFFQKRFVDDNDSDKVRLAFAVIVPLIASVLAGIYYFIYTKSTSEQTDVRLFTSKNAFLLLFAGLGLSIAYFVTPLSLKFGLINAVIVAIGITFCVTLISFFKESFDLIKFTGLILAIVSVVFMKFGTGIFNK